MSVAVYLKMESGDGYLFSSSDQSINSIVAKIADRMGGELAYTSSIEVAVDSFSSYQKSSLAYAEGIKAALNKAVLKKSREIEN